MLRVVKAWTTHGKHMEKPVVLVVEDEALIRISALHMIEDAGFAVVEASHADEAIGILQNRADIRAVFTDIKMPGSMDGWKLARAIRGRWPPIHLILASALVPELSELPANGLFIRKPYTAEQVTAALYELFNHDPASGPIMQDTRRNCARVA
jgi:CheY-like chemotaxis protein